MRFIENILIHKNWNEKNKNRKCFKTYPTACRSANNRRPTHRPMLRWFSPTATGVHTFWRQRPRRHGKCPRSHNRQMTDSYFALYDHKKKKNTNERETHQQHYKRLRFFFSQNFIFLSIENDELSLNRVFYFHNQLDPYVARGTTSRLFSLLFNVWQRTLPVYFLVARACDSLVAFLFQTILLW